MDSFTRKVHVRELNRNIIIIAYNKTFSVCVIIVAILAFLAKC